jgi:lipopolysaccharide/colanic/teichoic acid biosynthesis glycosyltransferase
VIVGRVVQRWIKRMIDLLGALLLLTLFSPLMALIAIALRIRNGAPVIHRETRYGLNGQPFTLFKFRTLTLGAGSEQSIAAEGDKRIEPLGQFLRRWRLDEFPQLLHVLSGQMSLVGPRPLPEAHARTVPADVLVELSAFAPGLTGAAAVLFLAEDAVLAGRPNAEQCYLETVLPAKLEQELDYVRQWSLAVDLRILLQTMLWVWSPRARALSYRRIAKLLE